jgi:hypothetical protein
MGSPSREQAGCRLLLWNLRCGLGGCRMRASETSTRKLAVRAGSAIDGVDIIEFGADGRIASPEGLLRPGGDEAAQLIPARRAVRAAPVMSDEQLELASLRRLSGGAVPGLRPSAAAAADKRSPGLITRLDTGHACPRSEGCGAHNDVDSVVIGPARNAP